MQLTRFRDRGRFRNSLVYIVMKISKCLNERERENLRGNVHVRMTIFDKFYEVTGGI